MVNQSQFIEMFGDPVLDTQQRGKKPFSFFISNIRYGIGQPPKYTEDGDFKFIRATNIKSGRIIENGILRIDKDEAGKIAKCKLKGGEIIIVRSGVNTGDTCVITSEYVGSYAGYDIIIELNPDLANPHFFNELMNTHYMAQVIKPLTIRSAQPHLNCEQIESLPMILVDKKDQDRFETIIHQADKSKFAGFKSQFISQFGFPQDGDVKHPTSSIEALLEETISGEWGTDCADASGTRVIRTTNFTNDGVLNLDDVVLRSIDQKKVEKKQLHKGDIILEKSGGTKDNPVGRLVYFAEDGIYLANNFTQVLRPSNSVNSGYLFAALYYLYQTHKPLIKGLGNQTNGIQNLKVPQYLQLQVCVPDRKEQDAFEQVMQRADKSKYLN